MKKREPDFQRAWAFLDNLQFFKIKLGLESMQALLEPLGSPQQSLSFVHIGGTNGKGSTASFLVSLLADAGMRVGLYTSPHLESVLERFRINGHMIDQRSFAAHAERIMSTLDGRSITYFEFTTALALLWFAAEKVDIAVMEVGMGGRLDATNVITPLVSVITNVSMDHEHYLGHCLADVAREKAGIIKPGVPVVSAVCGGGEDGAALDIVEEKCRDCGAPLHLLGRDFFMRGKSGAGLCYTGLDQYLAGRGRLLLDCPALGLKGAHQIANAALALAAAEVLQENGFAVGGDSMRRGLAEASWPGRLETLLCRRQGKKVRVVLDGAHNPAGVRALVQSLQEEFSWQRLLLVWGAMADKDGSLTLPCIAPLAATIFLTAPKSERAASPEHLQRSLAPPLRDIARICGSVRDGLHAACETASGSDLVCVAGSLYLIGEARGIVMEWCA